MVTEIITLQVRVKLTSHHELTKSGRQEAIKSARELVTNSSRHSSVSVIPMTAKLIKPTRKAAKNPKLHATKLKTLEDCT